MKLLSLLALALSLALRTQAATNETLYQTSFEAPAFTPGLPIRGQDGWEMFHDGEAISIGTNNARTGTQCLWMDGALIEQTGPNFAHAYCFSRALLDATSSPPPIVEITAYVRLDGPQTGTNRAPADDLMSANLLAFADTGTQGVRLGGFLVSSAGRTFTIGSRPEDAYKYSAPMTFGSYHKLVLRVDFVARTLRYFVNGTYLGFVNFAATITSDRLAGGYLEIAGPIEPFTIPYHYAPADYTAYFDDYSLVSVPLSPVNAIIEFASAEILADEFMPSARINVTRRGFTSGATRVTVSTTNDTAIAGEDYEAVSTFVTFAAGETNKVVQIPLHDDFFAEPDKSFLVGLTGLPPGATSGNPLARVLIRDDERPGSIDHTWYSTLGLLPLNPGEVKYLDARIVTQQSDGALVLNVQVFDSNFNGLYYRIIRIHRDGSADSNFPLLQNQTVLQDVIATPEGKMLVVVQGPPYRFKYRLNSDGSQDATFAPILSGSINLDLTPQPDGKVVVSGGHPQNVLLLNGQRMRSVFRLNNNGTLDSSFAAPTNVYGTVRLLANGQLLVNDTYTLLAQFYRLNGDGSLDSSFTTITNLNLALVQLLPNGQIVATSSQPPLYDSTKLYRLNPDGSLDDGFAIGTAGGPPNQIIDVLAQPDRKLIVVGNFSTFNGQLRNSIVRLNADGSIDSTFQTGAGIEAGSSGDPGYVADLLQLSSGQVLVSGSFDTCNGQKVTPPIILNADGSRDSTFDGTIANTYDINGPVYLITTGDGGSLFRTTDDALYFLSGYGMGRLRSALPLRIVSSARDTDGTMRFTANALAGRSYTLQASQDLSNWADMTTQLAATNRTDFTVVPAIPPVKRFYRVKQN